MPRLDELGFPRDGYDWVIPGLAQADTTHTPAELLDGQGFDAVFDLCGWPRDDGMDGRPYVFFPLDDAPTIPDPDAIDDLGAAVAGLVRAGKRVAVNCAAGLNRSGLVVGRALIWLGHEPARSIAMVRAARGPWALSNVEFARYLMIECRPVRSHRVGPRPR
jgi:hypothetical protein